MKKDAKKILIIDYGMGNIMSVAMALEYLGADFSISAHLDDIQNADAYILPGVGAFNAAMKNIYERDLLEPLTNEVVGNKKPFLGICLGMQLLAESSTEKGFTKGFGWIQGEVVNIEPDENIRVPHVGWNNITHIGDTVLFDNMAGELNFYFDHSYHMKCNTSVKIAECCYGKKIVAAVRQENIFATQFHPEKSQRNGLKLLRNYLNFINSAGGYL